MRIVVAGGGTAGHISPILAAVDELKRRDKSVEVLYVGQNSGMESDMAQAAGIKFKGISAGKYRRIPQAKLWEKLADTKSLALNVRDVGRTATGVGQSLSILKRFKPDVVFCKGGFVALPVGVAAKILNIPLVIHESDVTPGLGTKVLGRWADDIAVGFPPELYRNLPAGKVVFTGNPVRQEVLEQRGQASQFFEDTNSDKSSTKLPVVLVIGGSQGAVRINDAVIGSLGEVIKQARVIHVTGKYDYKRVEAIALARDLPKSRFFATDFMDAKDMAVAYSVADVVVSRAGANTLTELAATRKAVVLIPNSTMAAHQVDNARRLAANQAVDLLEEDELTPDSLLQHLEVLFEDESKRKALGDELAKLYVPDSTSRLVDLILQAGKRVKA